MNDIEELQAELEEVSDEVGEHEAEQQRIQKLQERQEELEQAIQERLAQKEHEKNLRRLVKIGREATEVRETYDEVLDEIDHDLHALGKRLREARGRHRDKVKEFANLLKDTAPGAGQAKRRSTNTPEEERQELENDLQDALAHVFAHDDVSRRAAMSARYRLVIDDLLQERDPWSEELEYLDIIRILIRRPVKWYKHGRRRKFEDDE